MIFDLREGAVSEHIPPHADYIDENLTLALKQIAHSSLYQSHSLSLSKPIRLNLLSQLIKYYQLHLDGMSEIHAHQILKEIF